MTYDFRVDYVPQYFNRACGAVIPARWTAEIVSGLQSGMFVYSDGCETKRDAIADLVAQAKRLGLSGTLRRAA